MLPLILQNVVPKRNIITTDSFKRTKIFTIGTFIIEGHILHVLVLGVTCLALQSLIDDQGQEQRASGHIILILLHMIEIVGLVLIGIERH